MTDKQLSVFEVAKAQGEAAVHKALAGMPCGDFTLGNELTIALAEGIRATTAFEESHH